MTAAELQARFRAAHQDGAPRLRYRRPAGRRSRPQRWREAVVELVTLQDKYQEWLDALPESLESSAAGEALRVICDLDLSELESVEPRRGFGRDCRETAGRSRLFPILNLTLWDSYATGESSQRRQQGTRV